MNSPQSVERRMSEEKYKNKMNDILKQWRRPQMSIVMAHSNDSFKDYILSKLDANHYFGNVVSVSSFNGLEQLRLGNNSFYLSFF